MKKKKNKVTTDPGSPYPLLFRSPRGHLQMLEKRLMMQSVPPPNEKHWMKNKCTVFVSEHLETDNVLYVFVILRQKNLTTIRPVWRYNVGNLFVARPKRVLKREL